MNFSLLFKLKQMDFCFSRKSGLVPLKGKCCSTSLNFKNKGKFCSLP